MKRYGHLALALCAFIASCASESYIEPHRGGIGESCQARNDCASGLACMRGSCVPGGLGLQPTGKECHRVECGETADCCATFVPDINCPMYEDACNSDPGACLPFLTLCRCNAACEQSRCIDRGPRCASDAHCPFVDTPLCDSGRCVQCRADADCRGAGERCLEGTCERPCSTDAQCPLLHTCDGGDCVYSGCTSHRECVFLLDDGRAVCKQGSCEIGCSNHQECDASAFEVCQAGQCTFAGCQTHAECRAALGLENTDGGVRAECK